MKKVRFYNVCPFHTDSFGMGKPRPVGDYLADVRQHAVWADENGLDGIVIYNFNTSLDPFLTAQTVLAATKRIRPLVAVQPSHMHPFVLVRTLSTLSYLYGRGVDLNVVAGASPADQQRMGTTLGYEERHEHLREYVQAVRQLAMGEAHLQGSHFQLSELSVDPQLKPDCRPQFFIPGSSDASCETVRKLADSSLLMIKPLQEMREEIERLSGSRDDLRQAVIVGVIARETEEEAWEAALGQGADRRMKLTARLFVSQTSSLQHRTNVELAERGDVFDGHLWYGSDKIGIDAPKLVGSYEQVREALARYVDLGVTDILLDLPSSDVEFEHILKVIQPMMPQAAARNR